jgi:hypothetical protein
LKKWQTFPPSKRERERERERNYSVKYIFKNKIPKLLPVFFCQENCKNCGGGKKKKKKKPLIF